LAAKRGTATSGGAGDAVTAALQAYADRGVFRAFRVTPGPRGRVEYEFLWVLGRSMRATYDPARAVLAFPALFPGVEPRSAMAPALDALVHTRTDRGQPAHKRVDARRARLSSAVSKGDWSLTVHIRGANQDYAVQRALNLVNELFLLLHESYPEYLIERFGLSPE
jgi:hypothetical protein